MPARPKACDRRAFEAAMLRVSSSNRWPLGTRGFSNEIIGGDFPAWSYHLIEYQTDPCMDAWMSLG